MTGRHAPAHERFFRHVEKTDGCWNWVGATPPNGYGLFGLSKPLTKKVLAHRWSYEFHVGPIPEGLEIDHLCRNTRCVNPEHLEAVTPEENIRRIPRPTHCPSGHPYDEANTYVGVDRRRKCRTCNRLYVQAKRAGRTRVAA